MHYRVLGACAAALGAFLPVVAAECNRTYLESYANDYISTYENGKIADLKRAENFTYVENNKTTEFSGGIFDKSLVVAWKKTIVDPVECASFVEFITTKDSKGAAAPYVIGSQIRHSPGDLSTYLIDSIVSTTGSWLFNSTKTLEYATQENWTRIDDDKLDSREALKLAADAYLDMWNNKSAVDAVPWGNPCSRLEGSVYTGTSCKVGIPTNNNQAPNSHRRYVIDQAYGSISVLCIFEHLSNAPDSHEFRMENGKLRYIHTITIAKSGFLEVEEPAPVPVAGRRARRGGASSRLLG
ncbi:uncharacterized protein F4822DRAFT_249447 [Hypoxylon trugodes]|uniref:uncharacterized protein n=1 Tax=Hypoxylon trugodes TaxID=326681 RepID=UPI002198F202|nr:uncharacterized protein F4822DRAFT_249447 [Hypoxylon trugodes]KAI1388536.1 hypothetical protein F4822DRAFT_249447 [Hypoxylon trugodes]